MRQQLATVILVVLVVCGALVAIPGLQSLEAPTNASAASSSSTADSAPDIASSTGAQESDPPSTNSTATSPGLGVELNESDLPSNSPTTADNTRSSSVPTTVIVEATNRSAVNVTAIERYNATVGSQHDQYIEVTAPQSVLYQLETLPWVVDIHPAGSTTDATRSGGIESLTADRLHELGVTGDGVKVGILTGGVRPSAPAYAEQVAATRSFHPLGLDGSDPAHGSGVTELVAETAPGASLYLTTFDSGVDYANAISWLQRQDVDVIVMSRSWFWQPDTGNGWAATEAASAVDDGIFWANSAGNAAQKHWQGSADDTDADGWLTLTETADGADVETVALNNGRPLSAGTTVQLDLKWHDFPSSSEDYTLYLINADSDIIASSSNVGPADEPIESLEAPIPADGQYGFAIAGERSDHTVEVFGSAETEPFGTYVRAGSIRSPAAAPEIFGVGAYSVATGETAAYSAAGPTNAGQRGVDILAPSHVRTDAYPGRFYGTSAAAPHLGGAAALLLSINNSASPATIEQGLMQSATDVGPPGVDRYTGAGKTDVVAAAEQVDPTVPLQLTANRTTVDAGGWVSYSVTRSDTDAPVAAHIRVGNRTIATDSDGQASVQYKSAGTYSVTAQAVSDPITVDYAPATTETVAEGSAVLTLTNVTANTQTISPGESVTVTVTVTNTGAATGSLESVFSADGERFASKSVTVAPGASTTVTATTQFVTPGTHTISVGDRDPTSVSVREPRPPATIFSNQSVTDNSLTVAFATASVDYYVDIQAPNGTTLGTSPTFTAGQSQESFTVELRRMPQTDTVLTAVLRAQTNGTALTRDTATVTTHQQSPLTRFDLNENGRLDFQDVIQTIAAYSSDEQIDNRPVSFRDVLQVIRAYNTGSSL